MKKKEIKALVTGEFPVINTSIKQILELFASKLVDVKCEVANIEQQVEEKIFSGDYTHIIITLGSENDREKGVILHNLLKIRLPLWRKNAKLLKAGIKDIPANDYIRISSIMQDIGEKVIF